MDSRLPARIDRATFDRLLQRAAELQAASSDIGDGVTEDELLALGKEVGIPEQHLRQALLEERTRAVPVTTGGTTLDRWVGQADILVERVVQGREEDITQAIAHWLEDREHFVLQRSSVGRTTFEPMSSFAGAMRKMRTMFEGGRGKPYLDRAQLVTAVVTPLESGFCHVTLAASLRTTRNSYVAGGTTLAGLGVTAAAIMGILGAPEFSLLLPVVPMGGAGWLVARLFRPIAERARLGLERALDDLERRPPLPPGSALPPSPDTSRFAKDVGRVVRDITTEVRKAFDQ